MHLALKMLQMLQFVPDVTRCLDSQAHTGVFSQLHKGMSSRVDRQD